MAECKPSEKSPTEEVDLTSISSILSIILGLFRSIQKPAQTIPPPLALIGNKLKPGMSARNLTARTLSRLESEYGIPVGDVFSDGPNRLVATIKTDHEEFVSMIQTEASVYGSLDPGSIQITGTGTAGPIPVVIQGSNINIPSFKAGIQ